MISHFIESHQTRPLYQCLSNIGLHYNLLFRYTFWIVHKRDEQEPNLGLEHSKWITFLRNQAEWGYKVVVNRASVALCVHMHNEQKLKRVNRSVEVQIWNPPPKKRKLNDILDDICIVKKKRNCQFQAETERQTTAEDIVDSQLQCL